MNRARILVGLAASLGVAVAAACGGGSSGNGNGNGASSSSGGSSGVSSGASSGGTENPDGSGGTGCASGQLQCMALLGGTSCIDPGTTCAGTAVAANECSATNPCSGGQVCCSSLVGSDGGVITYPDASADAAATPATGTGVGGEIVSVQCMAACPTNALSSQVCVLDADGGSPTACPEGTACQDYLPSFLASMTLPNTLCLPVYDGGGYVYPKPDGSTGTATADASPTTGTDATPGTDATSE
jgi:hypothetical protein